VSLDALLAANSLASDSIIYPGQALTIPAALAAAATVTARPDLGLDAEQVANAQLIIQVGRARGVPDRGIAIALATSMVESWIRNLDWGDRDSLGLFQQRPSTGWGSVEQVRDPARAAAAFYGGAGDPNGTATRGLLDIAGWESMAFADAAQAVQISAYPDRYGQWEQQAFAWLAALG
jgi:LysM repeat protein